MSKQLGPIDVCCDAPPYHIVRACRQIGVRDPEDVRWLRVRHLGNRQAGWPAIFLSQPWQTLLGKAEREEATCTCGQMLPGLDLVTFTFLSGQEAVYFIGQCRRCCTVFWDQT